MLKLIRTSTIPASLENLLKGQLKMLSKYYNVLAVFFSGRRYGNNRRTGRCTYNRYPDGTAYLFDKRFYFINQVDSSLC